MISSFDQKEINLDLKGFVLYEVTTEKKSLSKAVVRLI